MEESFLQLRKTAGPAPGVCEAAVQGAAGQTQDGQNLKDAQKTETQLDSDSQCHALCASAQVEPGEGQEGVGDSEGRQIQADIELLTKC